MGIRRFLALVVSTALLHFSVVAGDAACATHGSGEAHVPPGSAGQMAHHDMPAHDSTPCETPVQQHCCEAVIGCELSGNIAGAREILTVTLVPTMAVRFAHHDAPASFDAPPEPPPPKA